MLKCHAQILRRINIEKNITVIDSLKVKELLDWDAEKYRQTMVEPTDSK